MIDILYVRKSYIENMVFNTFPAIRRQRQRKKCDEQTKITLTFCMCMSFRKDNNCASSCKQRQNETTSIVHKCLTCSSAILEVFCSFRSVWLKALCISSICLLYLHKCKDETMTPTPLTLTTSMTPETGLTSGSVALGIVR